VIGEAALFLVSTVEGKKKRAAIESVEFAAIIDKGKAANQHYT